MIFLQVNDVYYTISVPVSASDDGRVCPLLNVVYFINVIYDMDLHFWKLRQYLPLKEGELKWNEKKEQSLFLSFS